MENKGRYVQSAWRRAWIMFDLDNGHKCGRNDVGKGYLWVFETKAKALAHQKEIASLTGSSIGINNAKRPHNWHFFHKGNKILCRSGYEVIYANFLMENGIEFKYEPKQFKLSNGVRYLPDFQIENTFIEVKGYLSDRSKVKMQKFSEDFNLQILYWDDLVVDCCLPFKSYSSFFKKAKTLNIEIEDFLAQQIYKKVK